MTKHTLQIVPFWFALLAILIFVWVASTSAAEPPITALAFSPDGESVIAASQAGAQILDWPDLRLRKTIAVAAANLHCLRFSPNEKLLAIGGGHPAEEGIVQVFSWPDVTPIATMDGHFDSVRSVLWQDDQRLLSAGIDREIIRWNLDDSTRPVSTLKGHSRAVESILLLRDENTLVSAGVDQSLRVWDVDAVKLIRSLSQHTKPVHDLALRPAAEGLAMVASAAGDRTIRFWQPTIGRMVRYVRLDAVPLCIAWLGDGTRIVASCTDGQVRVIDADEVKVLQTIPAINGWAYAVAIHPTERSLVVGGSNGILRRIEFDETNRL